MKVKNLIDILNQCNPEAEVVCSQDGEGNGYSCLDEVDSGINADLSRRWDVDMLNYHRDTEARYSTPVVVLYPT